MGAAVTFRVEVKPELLRWARERADADVDSLVRKFPKYREWESGDVQPTVKQLEKFAMTVHAGIGYFFLSEPPEEPFPIPDFRAVSDAPAGRPSLNLLHTIYLCQQRQDWYQEFACAEGEDPLPFVGSATLSEDIETAAARMRDALGFDLEERRDFSTWADASRRLVDKADALGVLVMVSGVVGSNSHRKLDPKEFRGFALADDHAPLIFVNGADTKAVQMFTLAHELAYLWLGETALSDSRLDAVPEHAVEVWCNQVAAELLVPLTVMREEYRKGEELPEAVDRLARRFGVSTLVVLRRIYDMGDITRERFHQAYDDELEQLRAKPGNSEESFHASRTARFGKRFAYALVADTLGGRTLYRDAFHLLGFSKPETFRKLAQSFGLGHGLPA